MSEYNSYPTTQEPKYVKIGGVPKLRKLMSLVGWDRNKDETQVFPLCVLPGPDA